MISEAKIDNYMIGVSYLTTVICRSLVLDCNKAIQPVQVAARGPIRRLGGVFWQYMKYDNTCLSRR